MVNLHLFYDLPLNHYIKTIVLSASKSQLWGGFLFIRSPDKRKQ